jgi:hypothetical protein
MSASFSKRQKAMRKEHRERAQPLKRAGLGLLEKGKDWKLRRDDFHSKERRLRALAEKARDRNADEFYFAMQREKTARGVHKAARADSKQYTADELKLLQTQDLAYVTMRKMTEQKVQRGPRPSSLASRTNERATRRVGSASRGSAGSCTASTPSPRRTPPAATTTTTTATTATTTTRRRRRRPPRRARAASTLSLSTPNTTVRCRWWHLWRVGSSPSSFPLLLFEQPSSLTLRRILGRRPSLWAARSTGRAWTPWPLPT